MKILGNEIKLGMIINHNNDLWEVIKTQHVKPGKGGAFNLFAFKAKFLELWQVIPMILFFPKIFLLFL